MKSVTRIINDMHMSHDSTLGDPAELELYGEPLVPSINYSTAYVFNSIGDLEKYHRNKFKSLRYTRDSSQLVAQLELYFKNVNANLETLVFNSGMAAINAILMTVAPTASKIITIGSFYRKTKSIIDTLQKNNGIEVVNVSHLSQLKHQNIDDSNLIFCIESPSNPLLELVDIKKLKEQYPNSRIIYDVTLQGLVNGQKLYNYADCVVSSCTKYIGGHNDLLAGFLSTANLDLYDQLWEHRSRCGGILDNNTAYLLLRSLRTYDVRMGKSLKNTELILGYLLSRPEVETVYYPGRYANSLDRELFDRFFDHGGGLVSFKVRSEIDLKKNMKSLLSIKMAPSFGSVDSLIELPAYMSHFGASELDLNKIGISRNLVRLSVGLEPIEYLKKDLDRLLHHDSYL